MRKKKGTKGEAGSEGWMNEEKGGIRPPKREREEILCGDKRHRI